MKTRQKSRNNMTKIKVETPQRSETPNSSGSVSDNDNSDVDVECKQFAIVTNNISKKRNIRNPVVSLIQLIFFWKGLNFMEF